MNPSSREARRIRDRLHRTRTQLLARLHETVEHADEELATPSVEVVDLANGQWDARVLSRLGDREASALAGIANALERLDRGDYGVCLRCGGHIARPRLRAMPTATECTSCAKRSERRGTPRA